MVSNKMLRTLALCLSFSIAGAASAQDRPLPHTDNIDATLLSEIKKQEIVGLAVIVIDRGEVAWSRAYGYADREQRIAVDLNTTQFRWASVSKPLTAIAAMQLAEKGQLDLDADIRTYVPEFPDKGVKITARQLLCHRGGIVHNNNLESKIKYAAPHPFEDVIVALDQFKEAPLVHSPGQQFEYSTQGYMLLSAVIERAGKQRFADQIQDRIAKPLGMKTLRPDFPWEDIPGRAAGYRRTDQGVERRPENEVTDAYWKWGSAPHRPIWRRSASVCSRRSSFQNRPRSRCGRPSPPPTNPSSTTALAFTSSRAPQAHSGSAMTAARPKHAPGC
jgi:CubicO group peptidase (beta-lactamase class C family)